MTAMLLADVPVVVGSEIFDGPGLRVLLPMRFIAKIFVFGTQRVSTLIFASLFRRRQSKPQVYAWCLR